MSNNIREQIKKFIGETDISQNAASRAVGCSPAALSKFLAGPGKYAETGGDEQALEEKIGKFLKRQSERKEDQHESAIPIIQTSVLKKIHEVARRAHIRRWLCVCSGDAGLGKTEACRAYAAEEKDVILIEAVLGLSSLKLFRQLHRACGFDGEGSTYDMFDDVVNKLRGSDRMIIVDEAENLPYRALELIRRVYDMAKIGILLVGMPKLIMNLRGKHGQYAQLYSRVRLAAEVSALNPMDVHDIVQRIFPNSNGVWKTFHEASNGNARVLSNLIENARDVAKINNLTITPEVVKETAKMLII
jgi:DNA transposition AAA+ family ATPase